MFPETMTSSGPERRVRAGLPDEANYARNALFRSFGGAGKAGLPQDGACSHIPIVGRVWSTRHAPTKAEASNGDHGRAQVREFNYVLTAPANHRESSLCSYEAENRRLEGATPASAGS